MQVGNTDESTVVNDVNRMLNNHVVTTERVFFRSVSLLDRSPYPLPEKGEMTYYINTTSKPLTVMDRDGVVRILRPDTEGYGTRFNDNDLRRLNPDCLIVIKSIAHDLSAIDSRVRHSNDVRDGEDALAALSEMQNPISDFARTQTSLFSAARSALATYRNSIRSHETDVGISDFEPGVFVSANYIAIPISKLKEGGGNYIQALDVLVRIEEYEVDSFGNRTLIPNTGTLVHPFSIIGITYNTNGGLAAFDTNVYYKMIRIVMHERKSSNAHMFYVDFGKIVKIPIQIGSLEEEGIYITSRSETGEVREVRHSVEDAHSLGLFEFIGQAEGIEQEQGRKYVTEDHARRLAELEEAKRQSDTQEAARKNDAARKSDVIKTVVQGFVAAAAVIGAIVTLVKIFAPSKFFGALRLI